MADLYDPQMGELIRGMPKPASFEPASDNSAKVLLDLETRNTLIRIAAALEDIAGKM